MRLLGLALTALLASSCVVVVSSDCHNGVRDGDETDVDCGGSTCGPCGVGGFCSINRDCTTNFCAAGVCSPTGVSASCSDGVRNGNETDIDCGGSCAPCSANKACNVGADCASTVCTGHFCTGHPTGAGAAPMSGDILSIASGQGATTPSGGFGITASGIGTSVTMRLTALATSSAQEFYGSIWSAGGLTNVQLGCGGQCTAPAAADFVSQPYASSGGTRIDFDIIGANTSGFDFDVGTNSSGQPVYFDLFVDANASPPVNFISGDTGTPRTPSTLPFGLYAK